MKFNLQFDNKEWKKVRNVVKKLPAQMRISTGRFALKKVAKFYEGQTDRGIVKAPISLRRSYAQTRPDDGYFRGKRFKGINFKVSIQSARGSGYGYQWIEHGTADRYTRRGKYLGRIRPYNIVKKVLKKKSNSRKAREIYKLALAGKLSRMVKKARQGA